MSRERTRGLSPLLSRVYSLHLKWNCYILGESQKAITDFNQAIRLNPNLAGAYGNRGLAYGKLGESQKAIADLQKAVTLFQQQGDTATAQKILDVLRKVSQ
jgi:tetratricopeptide (TPR) repeat protein